MKEITVEDVEYAAKLAKLDLSEEEKESMTSQLREVLNYMAKLNELNTDDVEPTAHVLPIKNVWRADEREPSLEQDKTFLSRRGPRWVMRIAPKSHEGQIRVPRVVE